MAGGAAAVIVTDGWDGTGPHGAPSAAGVGRDGLPAAVRAATDGHGADLVLDAEGGPRVEHLVAACAPGAAVIVHGGLSGQPTPLPAGGPDPVWLRRYHVFEITTDPAAMRRAEHYVRSGLAAGALTPMVDRVFAFDDVVAAHRLPRLTRSAPRQAGTTGTPLTSTDRSLLSPVVGAEAGGERGGQ